MVAVGMQATVDGIVSSRAPRASDIRRIRANVSRALRDSATARRNGAPIVRMALAAGRAALKGQVGSMRQETDSALNNMRRQVRQALAREERWRLDEAARLGGQRRGAISALRQDARTVVSAAKAGRPQRARALSMRLIGDVAAIRSSVAQDLSANRADLAQARAHWRMVSREAAPPKAEEVPSPPKAQAVPSPPIAELSIPAPETEVREEETRTEADHGLVTRLFDDVADHPDGVRMRELEERLGANRFQVMRALRTLLEEGKLRREDGVYFAR